MRLVFLVGLAACYSPRVTPGVACETACPGDQRCIDGFCRDPGFVPDAMIEVDARIDGSPAVDTDSDGVFDDADNCVAIANLDQHDEDHDDLGDRCDPCPHIAVGGAADGDADGVGDACDPAPASAKQRWAYFDPFVSRRSEWSSTSQATFANDQMRLTGFIELAVGVPNARVRLGGSVALGAQVPHQAAMEFGHLDDNHFHYVEFYDEGNGGSVKVSKFDGVDYLGVVGTDYAGSIPTGAFTWTVDYSFTAQSVTFAATHGATTFPPVTGATTSPSLGSSSVLVFGTNHVTWTFDYLAVIETM